MENTKQVTETGGEALALHLLTKLREKGELSPWKLLCLQDKTLQEFYEAVESLKQRGLIELTPEAKRLRLTKEGKDHLAQVAGENPSLFDFKCGKCEGKGYTVASDEAFLARYKKLLETRPLPTEQYDQTSITAEDAVIRVGFFHERGDLLNKDLLMIGDFDCLSIVAALTGLPRRVLVLDVDDRLIAYINQVAEETGTSHILKAEKFDVRQPLPESYRGSFDVFSCDPVETLEGIKLYLSRGVSGLRNSLSSCAYIGLTTLEASRKKWYDIQKLLFDMNLVVTDIRRNFNEYPDTGLEEMHIIYEKLGCVPDCVWYWAALLRVECVGVPSPLITGAYDDQQGPDIYLDDEAWATPILPSSSSSS
ncbi:N(4)-bis(aminopropyl)spermidine synthase [Balamuthia mandrillaris]